MLPLLLSLSLAHATERVRIVAVGDIMMHTKVKAAAEISGYPALFAGVREPIAAADIAFGNLETPIAPKTRVPRPVAVFDAPAALPKALAEVGFDVLSFANNHAYDQGPAGLIETLEHVRGAGLDLVGAGPTCEAARAPVIKEVNGIKLAFLAISQNTNIEENGDEACVWWTGERCENSLPVGVPPNDWCETYDAIHFHIDEAKVLAEVAKAREQADVVLLSVHYGVEYKTRPREEFEQAFQRFVDGGVDVVLAHHPHVLRPVKRHTAPDGREGLIAYSLGNFISGMGSRYTFGTSKPWAGNTRDGAMLSFSVTRAGDKHVVGDVKVTPVWTVTNQRTKTEAEALKIETMTHEWALAHGVGADLLAERKQQIKWAVGGFVD